MLEKVLIIVNPVAGKGKGKTFAEKLDQILVDHHQSQVEIKATQEEGDATTWASQAQDQGYDTVICLGGDGTVRETVTGLMANDQRPDFAFIPMGTVNDLARAVGYQLNPEKAIQDFKTMETAPLDIGLINDQDYFINVIAAGSIPEGVMDTEAEDKNQMGVLAYVKDGLSAMFNKHSGYKLTVTDGQGQTHQLETKLLLIGLTNSIGGIEIMVPQAHYSDGQAHLIAIQGTSPLDILRGAVEKGFEALNPESDKLLKIDSDHFKVALADDQDQDQDVQVNVDGDPGAHLPIDVKVLSQALTILIPKKD